MSAVAMAKNTVLAANGDAEMLQCLSTFLVACFIVATGPLRAIAQQSQQPAAPQPPQWGPGPWMMWSDGWAFWWICPLMMLFIVLVCGAVFLFARRSHGSSREPPWRMGDPRHSALQILSERFARGEIHREEYDQKRAAILSGG
jgi:uncharacterized membrane protein